MTYAGNAAEADYDHNFVIETEGVRIVGSGEVVLTSVYTSGVEYAQQTLTVNASDVTLENITVYPVENYEGRSKTLAIIGGNNVTVRNCTVYGSIYVGGPTVGVYSLLENTVKTYQEMQNTSINIANGAGSAMQQDEEAVVKNNVCEGAVLLLGVRDNGWDVNDLTRIPVIADNVFGSVYKQEKDCYLLIGSDRENSVPAEIIEAILSDNEFSGKEGNFESYDFEFYGTYYSYYY